jgi:phosphate transport system permease protein
MASLFPASSTRPRPRRPGDILLGLAGGLACVVTLLALGWVLWDLVRLGLPHLSVGFLTGEVVDSGRSGGIGPVLVSTLMILVFALAFVIPPGLGCAIWLSEMVRQGSGAARFVTGAVDLLASVPSIVFGLFGMSFFCQTLGLGFSILSGGLTLACMILPLLVRTTLSALQSLPADLRPAAAALGLAGATTIGKILLPAALPGILVGITLGVGRALAETAALIFTSGYATRWPVSPADSGRALSVHLYDLAMNIPNGGAAASASALVLLVLIALINATAAFLAARWHRHHLAS